MAISASLAACTTIPSGRTGVEWTPMKGTIDHSLNEGLHVVSPFSRIYLVDLREQQQDIDLDVLADNGLEIKLRTSILYQPVATEAAQLIRETGPDYYATLIGPNVRSSARRVVGRYSPEEIYSSKREQIEREIRENVAGKLAGAHLRVNAILIREVHLPEVVQSAIQAKLEEEQKALEMRFVLDRTRQEAERKRIEAAGIADYQSTISRGLSDRILAWQGIEATEKLAESPNAKVVVIGSGKDGLPLILNATSSAAPAVAKNSQ
ncbi:MAG TPA: prohibitin family protein [Steroidobacteraceae bacterium]|nr:prohibitin family protein [Steroidobacteraceae bacterium]